MRPWVFLLLACGGCKMGGGSITQIGVTRALTTSIPDSTFTILTDASSYSLKQASGLLPGVEVTIGFVMHNSTAQPIYLVNCNGIVGALLEQRLEGTWVTAWAGVYQLCLSPALVIQPGAQRPDSIRVFSGATGSNAEPKFRLPLPTGGTYRLRWNGILTSFNMNQRPFGNPVPLEQQVSNAFTLRVAQ